MQMRGLFVLAVAIGIVFTAETLAQNSCGGLARITETTTLRSDCSGSHASGFVDEQTISSHITASAEGAHAHGYVNDATIIADDSGSIALGFASSGGQILSSAVGSIAGGYANDAIILSDGNGAIAMGFATSGGSIESVRAGALAGGYATIGGSILADSDGAVALGHATSNSTIVADNVGAFAVGYANDFGVLEAVGEGSVALGSAVRGRLQAYETGSFALGYALNNGAIFVDGEGALAIGYANDFGRLEASGAGSFALGHAVDNSSISAEGPGAFALGDVEDNARILATEEGSFAAGIARRGDLSSEHRGAIALGINVATSFDGQTVVGMCNDPAVDFALDAVFSVGVGTFSMATGCTASDTGLVVDNQGNLYVKGNVFVQGASISANQANGMRRSSDDINTEDLQTQEIRSSRTSINLMEAVERIALLEAKLCKLVGDCPAQAAN